MILVEVEVLGVGEVSGSTMTVWGSVRNWHGRSCLGRELDGSGLASVAWLYSSSGTLGRRGLPRLPLELWGKAWLLHPTWPAPHLPF